MIDNKIIVYTSGTFDLPHVGHTNVLKKAKALGDILIVGVSTNRLVKQYKKINPVLSYRDRAGLIKDLRYVDKTVKQDTFFDIEQLKSLYIDIIVLGSDWKGKKFPELRKCIRALNIKMIYVPYTERLSSSKIKEKIIRNSYNIIKNQIKRKK